MRLKSPTTARIASVTAVKARLNPLVLISELEVDEFAVAFNRQHGDGGERREAGHPRRIGPPGHARGYAEFAIPRRQQCRTMSCQDLLGVWSNPAEDEQSQQPPELGRAAVRLQGSETHTRTGQPSIRAAQR